MVQVSSRDKLVKNVFHYKKVTDKFRANKQSGTNISNYQEQVNTLSEWIKYSKMV